MLIEATPAFGDVEHGRAASVAQDRAADEHRRPERGRTPEAGLALLRSTRVLIKTQQVAGEAHRQERALGGIEIPHAKAVGLQIDAWLALASLLGELARRGGEVLADASYRNQRSFKMESRLGRIIGHIEAHCEERLPLGEVARFAGLTPSSFARFFRKMTGKTFVEFRNGCRIRKACQSLVETDHSILEIAITSGFENLANFNRQFRKSTGIPPRDYRKLRSPG